MEKTLNVILKVVGILVGVSTLIGGVFAIGSYKKAMSYLTED